MGTTTPVHTGPAFKKRVWPRERLTPEPSLRLMAQGQGSRGKFKLLKLSYLKRSRPQVVGLAESSWLAQLKPKSALDRTTVEVRSADFVWGTAPTAREPSGCGLPGVGLPASNFAPAFHSVRARNPIRIDVG